MSSSREFYTQYLQYLMTVRENADNIKTRLQQMVLEVEQETIHKLEGAQKLLSVKPPPKPTATAAAPSSGKKSS